MIIHALIVVMKGTTIYNAIRHDEKFTSSMPFSLKNKQKERGRLNTFFKKSISSKFHEIRCLAN